MKAVSIENQVFGQLTVIRREGSRRGKSLWLCRCSCGTEKLITSDALHARKNVSCGCHRAKGLRRTHSMTRTGTYRTWLAMRQRCHYSKHRHYANYGGRGIKVCPRWRESFEAFLEDMGPRPPGMTIDRINNEKGYFKENCRWATRTEQQRNKRGWGL